MQIYSKSIYAFLAIFIFTFTPNADANAEMPPFVNYEQLGGIQFGENKDTILKTINLSNPLKITKETPYNSFYIEVCTSIGEFLAYARLEFIENILCAIAYEYSDYLSRGKKKYKQADPKICTGIINGYLQSDTGFTKKIIKNESDIWTLYENSSKILTRIAYKESDINRIAFGKKNNTVIIHQI